MSFHNLTNFTESEAPGISNQIDSIIFTCQHEKFSGKECVSYNIFEHLLYFDLK